MGLYGLAYNDVVNILSEKYGYNVAERTIQQMLEETGGVRGDIAEQINWFSRFFNSNDTPYETASEVGRILRYKSGNDVGIYTVTETGSVGTSVIDSTATELATIESAFGTEIIEYEGSQAVSLSSVGSSGGTISTIGKIGDFIVGTATPAIIGAGIGVMLGVVVDSVLYRSNPDYWDEKLPTLNPQTWDDLGLLGHDTKIPFLHNTRTGTSYVDEKMVAYTALFGDSENWFTSGVYDESSDNEHNILAGFSVAKTTSTIATVSVEGVGVYNTTLTCSNGYFTSLYTGVASRSDHIYFCYPAGETASIQYTINGVTYVMLINGESDQVDRYNIDGKIVNCTDLQRNKNTYVGGSYIGKSYAFLPTGTYLPDCVAPTPRPDDYQSRLCWIAIYGNVTTHHEDAPEGISKIGVVPQMSGISTIAGAKAKLRTTYPNLYNNAVNVPFVNQDGTSTSSTWLPVSLPSNYIDDDGNPTKKPNNKPTSNNLNQTDDGSYPDDKTKEDTNQETVTPNITVPEPINPVNPINPNEPTPTPVVPVAPTDTGLGAVYVPTIAQLRSFSEWLWSPNFIDQIKKLFSDPMQGIIGLHQVYFSPTHDGTDTIHCGYLDSEIQSDYTIQRYYKVNCGTINVREIFGNVFDYDPLTTLEMYLPFIGIVPLKVGDVMRSALSVEYVCDVLTGACLCNIYVNRDGAKCVLYTYGGNCAVNYPLSSGSYMGIVSSLVGVGLSIGTAIATGGASIPLSIGGGALSMMNAHTNVQTSGGYSGNTGAMGIKKPYLIIKNTLSAMPDNYKKYTGNPYNNTNKLSSCTGFTQANVLHLNGDMTPDEKTEIINLFASGVII